MRSILLASLFAILLIEAAPAQRASTLAMTCREANALLDTRGAAVLSTGPHRYDRFVAHESLCAVGEYARPEWAPTRDRAECQLGYVCQAQPDLFDED